MYTYVITFLHARYIMKDCRGAELKVGDKVCDTGRVNGGTALKFGTVAIADEYFFYIEWTQCKCRYTHEMSEWYLREECKRGKTFDWLYKVDSPEFTLFLLQWCLSTGDPATRGVLC